MLRVVVTSRHRPGWASARRMLHGEILEMGHQQLAMSDAEAAKLLDGRPGDSVQRLVAQAQGWPARDRVGLARHGSGDPGRAHDRAALPSTSPRRSTGRRRASLRRFMLLASVPSSLNVAVARSVIDESDASPLLEGLLDAGLVHPAREGELSFHPLLREFLRRKLEEDDPQAFAALARPRGRLRPGKRALGRGVRAVAPPAPGRDRRGDRCRGFHGALTGRPDRDARQLARSSAGRRQTQPPALLVKIDVLLRQGRVREAHALSQDMVAPNRR